MDGQEKGRLPLSRLLLNGRVFLGFMRGTLRTELLWLRFFFRRSQASHRVGLLHHMTLGIVLQVWLSDSLVP